MTPTLIVPAATTFVAGMVACNCVAESKLVVIATPSSVIESPFTKPTPVAVNVKAGLPDAMELGDIEVRLYVLPPPPPVPVMVKSITPEVVVSAFITRTATMPALAICAAEIDVVSCVGDTTLVGCAIPSHRISVPAVKFVPVAVRVNPALPAATVAGEIDVSVGVTTP